MGEEYLFAPYDPFLLDDIPRLGGGAINAARGSLDAAGAGVDGAMSVFFGIIGGGG